MVASHWANFSMLQHMMMTQQMFQRRIRLMIIQRIRFKSLRMRPPMMKIVALRAFRRLIGVISNLEAALSHAGRKKFLPEYGVRLGHQELQVKLTSLSDSESTSPFSYLFWVLVCVKKDSSSEYFVLTRQYAAVQCAASRNATVVAPARREDAPTDSPSDAGGSGSESSPADAGSRFKQACVQVDYFSTATSFA